MTERTNELEVNELETATFEVGEKVVGTVTMIEDKHVIVTVENCKYDCIIPISELANVHIEKAADVVSLGDKLELIITKIEDEKLILSKRRVVAEASWQELEEKFNNKETIEAEIQDVVKGGVVVDLGVRGFVPASMLDDKFVEDLSVYKGQVLTFKIVEMDKERNHVILSHREVVREQKAVQQKAAMEALQVGQVLEGTVVRLTKFGAFVLLGEVEGLVHVSQISHERVADPADVLSEGEEVKVKILNIDPEANKISLSIKETLAGPWEMNASELAVGNVLEGTVKRLAKFGAFVEVFPGVEGLVHISQISHERVADPADALQEGQQVKVKVLNIDPEANKLSLSIKETLVDPWEANANQLTVGNVLEGTVKRIADFGAFVEVFPSIEGLVHISQIAHRHIKTPHEAIHEGETVKVKILDVDFEKKKLSLSIKALLENENEEITDYELPEESSGYQLSELFGDKLSKLEIKATAKPAVTEAPKQPITSSEEPKNEAKAENEQEVYYTQHGKSYHKDKECSALSRSKNILSGSLKEVISLGHSDPCDKCAL